MNKEQDGIGCCVSTWRVRPVPVHMDLRGPGPGSCASRRSKRYREGCGNRYEQSLKRDCAPGRNRNRCCPAFSAREPDFNDMAAGHYRGQGNGSGSAVLGIKVDLSAGWGRGDLDGAGLRYQWRFGSAAGKDTGKYEEEEGCSKVWLTSHGWSRSGRAMGVYPLCSTNGGKTRSFRFKNITQNTLYGNVGDRVRSSRHSPRNHHLYS